MIALGISGPRSYFITELGSSIISYTLFMREVRSFCVRASITIVQIRKFYKMYKHCIQFRFCFTRITIRRSAELRGLFLD